MKLKKRIQVAIKRHLAGPEKISNYWPLVIALVVLWVTVATLLVLSLQETEGHFTYTLDDAYIHMAMAKNLAQHGVYGMSKYEFSSSSSSPLWTLVLAFCFLIFGVHELLPFILNVILASGILVVMFLLLRRISSNKILQLLTLIAVVYFTPFSAMIFSGMEHLLHILLTVLFIQILTSFMIEPVSGDRKLHTIIFFFLAVGVTMTRFESYALLLTACLFLLIRGKWKMSVALAFVGFVPLVVYQYISVSKGWFWLPNSILIRTNAYEMEVFNSQQAIVINPFVHSGLHNFFSNGLHNIIGALHVSVLVALSCVLLIFKLTQTKIIWRTANVYLLIFIVIALAHLQFGKIGHFYRYEAYLVALGLFVLAYVITELAHEKIRWKQRMWNIAICGSLLLFCLIIGIKSFVMRGWDSLWTVPYASRNIFEQQYQMGLFLQQFYPGAAVAVNDIGAVSFLGDIRLLDLVGLASVDVLKLKTEGLYTTEQIDRLCREKNVAIAIVYDFWFYLEGLHGLPATWRKVGEWKIDDNIVCGFSIVAFYAVNPMEEEHLTNSLRTFVAKLPFRVGHRGIYQTKNISSNVPIK